MDLSPYDQCRCDKRQCSFGRSCNIIFLAVTLIFISGFAIASSLTPCSKTQAQHSQHVKK